MGGEAHAALWMRSITLLSLSMSIAASLRPCTMPLALCASLSPRSRLVASASSIPPLLPKLIALSGPVSTGFQRGSAQLGFPTANLPCSLFQQQLQPLHTGVYVGWAGLRGKTHKCVCNLGISPSFVGKENPEKIFEAHLIADGDEIPKDFYGEQLRLLLLGYVRPERRFDFSNGPGELIAAISNDVEMAKASLDVPPMSSFKGAAWLVDTSGEPSFEMLDPAQFS